MCFYKIPKPLLLDNINFLIWHTREQRTFYTHLSAARTYKTIGKIEFVCFLKQTSCLKSWSMEVWGVQTDVWKCLECIFDKGLRFSILLGIIQRWFYFYPPWSIKFAPENQFLEDELLPFLREPFRPIFKGFRCKFQGSCGNYVRHVPNHPCLAYIYLHVWCMLIFMVNVGKYTIVPWIRNGCRWSPKSQQTTDQNWHQLLSQQWPTKPCRISPGHKPQGVTTWYMVSKWVRTPISYWGLPISPL